MTDILSKDIKIIENALDEYLGNSDCLQGVVIDAMRYSLEAGGKRIRPVLAIEFCKMLGGDTNDVLSAACAVEMIHTFSLIHDDLPCMDDDDFRRGKPSCHKKYGEALAVLAGDALSLLACEIVASDEKLKSNVAVKMIRELTSFSGADGMIGGQVIDVTNEGKQIPKETLMVMHMLKTSALIKLSCRLGCIAANASKEQIEMADDYANLLGLAFQVIDDILDAVGDESVLGKPTGSDVNKTTFVTVYGVEKAKELAFGFTKNALQILDKFENNYFLVEFTKMLLDRNK